MKKNVFVIVTIIVASLLLIISTYCISDINDSNNIKLRLTKAHPDSIGCPWSGVSLTGTRFFPPRSEEIKKLPDQYNIKDIFHYALQPEQYAYSYAKKSLENENYIKSRYGHDWIEKVKNKYTDKEIDCIVSFCFIEDKTGQEYIAIDINNDEEFTKNEIYNFKYEEYKIHDYNIESQKASSEIVVDLFIDGKTESIKIPIGISKSWRKGSDRTHISFSILEAGYGILDIENNKYKVALLDGNSIFYSKYSHIYIDSNQNGVFEPEDIYNQLLNPFSLLGNTYEATVIDSLGRYIIIQKTNKLPPLQKGMEAPDIEAFTLMDSTKIKLSSYRGKYILLDFWASYCGPCLNEIKTLKEAYNQFNKKGFEIISIGSDRPKDLIKVIQDNEISWPQIAIKQNDEILKLYQVSGLPTYYLINPEGDIIMMSNELRSKGIIKSIETYIKK